MGTITKKLKKQIDYLNWKVEPTYEALFRYLMDHETMYVMAFPTTKGWDAKIVLLCKPNKFDGLINAVDVDCTVKTYDDAIRKGVELAVDSIYKAYREMSKHLQKGDLEEFFKTNEECMKKEGFDGL